MVRNQSAIFLLRSARTIAPQTHLPFRSLRLYSSTTATSLSSFSSSTPTDLHEDFYRYTSGRWLWNEAAQLQKRYRRFNVAELQNIACKALGDTSSGSPRRCMSISKLGDAYDYKLFQLQMDDGRVVTAKLPLPNAGSMGRVTASEVATVEFARNVLDIPVPKILAWNASVEGNPVGAEYIIMEDAFGDGLGLNWHEMTTSEKRAVIDEVVDLEQKMLAVSLNLSGSLYLAESGFDGCKPAEISTGGTSSLRDYVKNRFVIGPTVDPAFWVNQKDELAIDRGPWVSAENLYKAVAYREMAWIKKLAEKYPLQPGVRLLKNIYFPPDAHIELLEKYLSVIPMLLPNRTDLLRPTLWHNNMTEANIYFKNGKISSVVDWESSYVAPLIHQAHVPRFMKYATENPPERPGNFQELSEAEQDNITSSIARFARQKFYFSQTALENPLLSSAYGLPQKYVMTALLSCAGDSWTSNYGYFMLREALLKIQRRWEILRLKGQCPYHFTKEQRDKHLEEGEGFNDLQDIWDLLHGRITRDGFVDNEAFDAAVDIFAVLREMLLQEEEGERREELKKELQWVVDHLEARKGRSKES